MNANPEPAKATASPPRPAWVRTSWVLAGLAAGCALSELAAGPGYRLGWWGLGLGLQTIRWATKAAAVVLVLALLGAAMTLRGGLRRALAVFLAAATLSFLAAAPPTHLWLRVHNLPHIHDVSTDTVNPPQFIAVLPLRKGARNLTEYDAADAARQRLGYPDIAPALLTLSAPQAFVHVERVARAMGWEIVADDPNEMRIEATATTLLFGFKDDIVIRVTPSGSGSRVDLRSLSRIGGSDFGANANRIRVFLEKLGADVSA